MKTKENMINETRILKENTDYSKYAFPVTKIIYSSDHKYRFVILKEDIHMFSYRLELLMSINDKINQYEWNSPCCSMSHSLFYSEEDAINDIKLTEEYEKYFNL